MKKEKISKVKKTPISLQPDVINFKKAGDTVTGELVSIKRNSGKFKSTAITMQLIDKQVVIFLPKQLEVLATESNIGKTFEIIFEGKQKTLSGNEMKTFSVNLIETQEKLPY